MGKKLSGKDLIKLGFPKNNSINVTLGQINRYQKRVKKEQILQEAKNKIIIQYLQSLNYCPLSFSFFHPLLYLTYMKLWDKFYISNTQTDICKKSKIVRI